MTSSANNSLPTDAQSLKTYWTDFTASTGSDLAAAPTRLLDANKTEFINVKTDSSDYSMNVWLYANDAFTKWSEARSAASDTAENEKVFFDGQSSYTLTIECNVTWIGDNNAEANKTGFGCCL